MPYNKKTDLPDSVKNNLPAHAQDIYLESFNNAWNEYKQKSKRRTEESLEQISHKVAWSAVKKKYHKVKGKWEEK